MASVWWREIKCCGLFRLEDWESLAYGLWVWHTDYVRYGCSGLSHRVLGEQCQSALIVRQEVSLEFWAGSHWGTAMCSFSGLIHG
jgi:hypothetical protein